MLVDASRQDRCDPFCMLTQRERPQRPVGMELVPRRIFMFQSLDAVGGQMVAGRWDRKDRLKTMSAPPVYGELASSQNR